MPLRLTDHAKARYIERVLNITDAELLAMMVPESVRISHAEHGDGTYQISDRHSIEVQNGLIVTVTRSCGKRVGDKLAAMGKR